MYYNNIDGKTYTESEIKALYPNTSFPSPFVAPEEFSVVFDTPKPEVTDLQIAYQDGTELDSKGNRVVKWSIRDMFSDYTDESGVVHTKAEQEEAYLLAKFKATVPTTISPRQARLALNTAGLLDDVEAAVATNKEYQIFWEYSLEIKRDDTILNTMTAALGMTERQVDDLFIAAGKL